MPFDAASVAVLVAQAAARTRDGKFVIDAQATPYRASPQTSGIPAAALLAPLSAAGARLYSFQADYRRRVVSGSLVADVAFDLVARGLLAQFALDQFDYVDRRSPPLYLFGERVDQD